MYLSVKLCQVYYLYHFLLCFRLQIGFLVVYRTVFSHFLSCIPVFFWVLLQIFNIAVVFFTTVKLVSSWGRCRKTLLVLNNFRTSVRQGAGEGILSFHSKYMNRRVWIITAGNRLRPRSFLSPSSVSSSLLLPLTATSCPQTDIIPALKSFIIKNI